MNFIDLLAAIGRVQPKRQAEFHARRAEIAEIYCGELEDLEPRISFQEDVLHPCHARHLFSSSMSADDARRVAEVFRSVFHGAVN